MRLIRRVTGYIVLNTDAVEIIVVVCGLLVVWIVGVALIRQWRKGK